MSDLDREVKELIIDALELEDMTPEDIDSEAPLFNEGLGLDSIDALELGIALQKKYQIELKEDSEENKEYFRSVSSLAKFVASEQAKKGSGQ